MCRAKQGGVTDPATRYTKRCEKTKKEKDLGIHGIGRENYTIGTNKNDRPSLHDL